jgi:hypothetical protein
MTQYSLTVGSQIIRTVDGAVIPADPANSDYAEFQKWVAAGNTPDPVPAKSLPAQASVALTARIAAGIAITSTGTPALNATYALDEVSAGQIYQIGLYANQFAVFPSGAVTQAYPDINGLPHTFTVAQFVAFLRAVAPLVSAINTQAQVMAHGGTPAWPSQSAVIT